LGRALILNGNFQSRIFSLNYPGKKIRKIPELTHSGLKIYFDSEWVLVLIGLFEGSLGFNRCGKLLQRKRKKISNRYII
jgi:hypothetical protein